MTVKYELWIGDATDGYAFLQAGKAQGFKDRGLLSQDAQMIWEVEAETWILASRAYHEHMGRESYKPMLDPDSISEFEEEWNNLSEPKPALLDYLGLTQDEYDNYTA